MPRRIILAAVGSAVMLACVGGFLYWRLAYQPARWFVDTPLHISRTATAGEHKQIIQSNLLYGSNGSYSAISTTYEYGKPPAEQRYPGTWRQEGSWVCFRMAWQADREFCNTFVETNTGWVLLNKANGQVTPVSLAPLALPTEQELKPPAPPADCSFAGQTIRHAASVTAFEQSTVTVGQQCQAEVRTCTDGRLSGSFGNITCLAVAASPPPAKSLKLPPHHKRH
jgi:hypothetical protein